MKKNGDIVIAVSKFYASVWFGRFVGEDHKNMIIKDCINLSPDRGHGKRTNKYQISEFEERSLVIKNFHIFKKKR